MGNQSTLRGPQSKNWQSLSRPSKTNCTSTVEDSGTENTASYRRQWWREKNEIVDQFTDSRPSRAARPISVRGGTNLREECTRTYGENEEKHRSKSWSQVLNEFLKWFNGYRDAHLVFESPEGEIVRSQMKNAHQPSYGDRYYARLKALERQMIKHYDDLTVAMLTLTGSNRNANGGWRCPADHLRDVVNSWRPDEGRGVYHALQTALDRYEWEYSVVVEKHKSGYGHVHVALFIDGQISEEDFHPVIDAHLRVCDIAGRDAHDYYHPDVEKRPISVRDFNSDQEFAQDDGPVRNVASYIGEYIGAYGEALFDRGLDELMFRAACWATGTQMVRFSTGANNYINQELESEHIEQSEVSIKTTPKSDFNPDLENPSKTIKGSPFELVEGPWTILGIGRVDRDGEQVHKIKHSGIDWQEIEEASQLDPAKKLPPDQPKEGHI